MIRNCWAPLNQHDKCSGGYDGGGDGSRYSLFRALTLEQPPLLLLDSRYWVRWTTGLTLLGTPLNYQSCKVWGEAGVCMASSEAQGKNADVLRCFQGLAQDCRLHWTFK